MNLLLKNISLPLSSFRLETDFELKRRTAVIFGPSGSGKTSLLELIAGLRIAHSGLIQLDGETLLDSRAGICVPVRDRMIGYVPQDLALFPHLSVHKNLLYGRRTVDGNEVSLDFNRVVEVLEVEDLLNRSVTALSGGEKQRVTLARALLSSPKLLLLDEPLANLDMPLKRRVMSYLLRIRDEFKIPMLYVTHDRFEAMSLADEVLLLANGKVVAQGSPQDVFNSPIGGQFEGLLKTETLQPGRVIKIEDGLASVQVGSAILSALAPDFAAADSDVYVCIDAEDVILLQTSGASSARNHLAATVKSITPEGLLMLAELDCGFPLRALLTHQSCTGMKLKPGSSVVALIKAPNVHLFPH